MSFIHIIYIEAYMCKVSLFLYLVTSDRTFINMTECFNGQGSFIPARELQFNLGGIALFSQTFEFPIQVCKINGSMAGA